MEYSVRKNRTTSLRSKRFRLVLEQRTERPGKGIFGFDPARNETRAKKMKEGGGGGQGRKHLQDKPLDFENLRLPADSAPD